MYSAKAVLRYQVRMPLQIIRKHLPGLVEDGEGGAAGDEFLLDLILHLLHTGSFGEGGAEDVAPKGGVPGVPLKFFILRSQFFGSFFLPCLGTFLVVVMAFALDGGLLGEAVHVCAVLSSPGNTVVVIVFGHFFGAVEVADEGLKFFVVAEGKVLESGHGRRL